MPPVELYPNGIPVRGFNKTILEWLRETTVVKNHKTPPIFITLRNKYDSLFSALVRDGATPELAHRHLLSNLTSEILFPVDNKPLLSKRLTDKVGNQTGARTPLSQSLSKNSGENFVNLIVYSLAQFFEDSDNILVDKGTPQFLKEKLFLKRIVRLKDGTREIKIPIESDFVVFSRSNRDKAIIFNAKTRLKEVFHIGTMWKLFFDIAQSEELKSHWGLAGGENISGIKYCFATADMINPTGKDTQGVDVPTDSEPRNLIQMDASFFDYVFVSKNGASIASNLKISDRKEGLFHEMACIIDLAKQHLT
jgi:hypothetical protein